VFLYDEKQNGIGLIHAGWRGVQKNIVGKTSELMKAQWRSDPKNIKVAFGPSIRGCCYEVGKEFEDYFPGQLISRDSRYYLDLSQVCYAQLMDTGVRKENIGDCKVCTCCDQNYFSFRREGQLAGRMISLIMLKGKR
jgi:YfiH family protein